MRVDRIGDSGILGLGVDYTTTDGTATAGTDYTTPSTSRNWNSGDVTPRFIEVPIINHGFTDGSLRTLSLGLTGVNGDEGGATRMETSSADWFGGTSSATCGRC